MTYFEYDRWRGPLRQEVTYLDQKPSDPIPNPNAMYGVQAFTTLDFYQSANSPGGIAGTATGFWVAILFRVDSQDTSATRSLFARFTNMGWLFRTTGLNASLVFICTDGVGGTVSAPAYAITAADVGKIMLAVGVHDGTALKLYMNRVQVSTNVAITGFTSAADRTYIGRRQNGTPATSGTIFGACGGHAIPTLAEIQAMADAVRVAWDIVGIPGKTDSLWSVRQDQAGSSPAVLDDKNGAEDMQRQGIPTLVQVTSPAWGWEAAPPQAFDPATLFGPNDRGAIFDFTDPTKLFQLSTGTTPVTVPGDPIGYAADLGPLNKPASQATVTRRQTWTGAPRTLGSELAINGRFAADSDWTKGAGWTIASGVATKVAGSASVLAQPITLTPGKFYQIHYGITRTAGILTIRFAGGTTVLGLARSAAGSYTDVLLAVTGNNALEFSADAVFAGSVDNVTVKEVLTFTNMGAWFELNDDVIRTATVDMTNSDKLTMLVAGQLGQSSLAQTILAHGNYSGSLTGSADIAASSGLAARLRGDTAHATITCASTESFIGLNPQSNMLTASFDLAGTSIATEISLRARGTLPGQVASGATAGAGVFANSTITVGGTFGSGNFLGRVDRVLVINRTLNAAEIVQAETWAKRGSAYCAVLGDSTVAVLTGPNAMRVSSTIGGMICNAADISEAGRRIADQKASWIALANKGVLQAVFVQIGLNDVKGRVGANTATTAQVIADLQDLVNTIRADVAASCKIYICGLTPCKVWLDAAANPSAAYQAWLDVNAAIAGTYTTNITGVDARITSHVAALADGSNNLNPIYDGFGDGVHESNEARFIIGQAWRTQLEADGLV